MTSRKHQALDQKTQAQIEKMFPEHPLTEREIKEYERLISLRRSVQKRYIGKSLEEINAAYRAALKAPLHQRDNHKQQVTLGALHDLIRYKALREKKERLEHISVNEGESKSLIEKKLRVRHDPVYQYLSRDTKGSDSDFSTRHQTLNRLLNRSMTITEYNQLLALAHKEPVSNVAADKVKETAADKKRKLAARSAFKRLFGKKASAAEKEKIREKWAKRKEREKVKPIIQVNKRRIL